MRFIDTNVRTADKAEALGQERLGAIFLILILASLAVYIATLNFAISENFRKESIEKKMRLVKQEVNEKEELLISALNEYYNERSSALTKAEEGEIKFVYRNGEVAKAEGLSLYR